jgi:hypothetical protein
VTEEVLREQYLGRESPFVALVDGAPEPDRLLRGLLVSGLIPFTLDLRGHVRRKPLRSKHARRRPAQRAAPSPRARPARPHAPLRQPAAHHPAGAGVVEALLSAAHAEHAMKTHQAVELHAGRGIVGDRYFDGTGTFSASEKHGQQLTLIEAEVLDALREDGLQLTPLDARRNIVTRGIDLNALVGQGFQIGAARCIGRRLCEPCSHLQRLTGTALLRPMVHRGGLRADILTSGVVHVGDAIGA